MKVLVTGAAGFIGSFVAMRLLERGDEVVGLDNLNDYYDPALKQARLARLQDKARFRFARLDIVDAPGMAALFEGGEFQRVVHLAAQAGVRHSLRDPHSYVASNVLGTLNVLEGCRRTRVEHLVYASTSSVYGADTRLPFSVHAAAVHPLSPYGASKRSAELMAHSYSAVYGLPTTGLRLFTVYGPWGRPDMALFVFTRAMLAGEPIELFNDGQHVRDFTYIDDVAEGIVRSLDRIASADPDWDGQDPDPATSRVPFRLYNIGSNRPVELLRYLEVLEQALGRRAQRVLRPLQPGDVPGTCADVGELVAAVGYAPRTPIETGVRNFVSWYREYYRC